jgi:hypothetical protein
MVRLDHIWKNTMSTHPSPPGHAGTALALRGNLLTPPIRRDVADLNRLFLRSALDMRIAADPWFCLPAPALSLLNGATVDARERLAQSPFTLFALCLPGDDDHAAPAVADADPFQSGHREQADARRSFGLVALGVARRLAEGVPMSPRIAFGIGAEAETRLSGLSPSESFGFAAWPGLIRPRWTRHERYWCMLAKAASSGDAQLLRWAFATGMCLPQQHDRVTECPGTTPFRRKLRVAPGKP